MKKLNIVFSVLILSLLFVGCDNKSDTKKETKEESKIESSEESKDDNSGESKEESQVESIVESKESTIEETKENTKEESLVESKDETKKEKIVEVLEDEKDDKKTVVETINTEKSDQSQFNNKFTEEMQQVLKKYAVTLVSTGGNTVDNFPKEDLQAIAKYEDSESRGWVVRYGKNKIGLAQSYHKSTTGVFVMFDGEGVLENEKDKIKNDTPEEFKQKAQEIIKKQIPGDAKVEYAY